MNVETIELNNITKIFSNKKALNDVSLTFKKGTIHALLGENGAGKSTLVKILTGLIKQSSGTIKLNSTVVDFNSPYDSISAGIGIIHQNPYLVEDATVFENIVIGMIKQKKLFFSQKKLNQKIKTVMDSLKIELNLNAKVNTLTMEQKFYTAFMSVACNQPDFMILDEPWQDFSDEKKLNFFVKLKELTASKNIGLIFITHKLNHLFDFTDYVSVLKKGKLEKTFSISSKEELQNLIKEPKIKSTSKIDISEHEPAIKISNLSTRFNTDTPKSELATISLTAYKKSITAISTDTDTELELLESILFGTLPEKYKKQITGTIEFFNSNAKGKVINASKISPKVLRQNKVALIPANRYFRGSNPKLTIYEMLIANSSKNFFLNKSTELEFCQMLLSEQKVNAHPNMPVETLSGGELQRLIFARELHSNPAILVLSKPEQGLDFEKTARLKATLKKQTEMQTSIIILTRFTDDNILNDVFDTNYLYKDGVLCEIQN